MKYTIHILLLWLFFGSCTIRTESDLPDLTDLNGKERSLPVDKKTKGIVYFFMVPDCPFSQYYTMSINQIHSVFAYKGYQFYAIVPGTLYSKDEINAFKDTYKFIPEILLDKTSAFTKKLKIKVVPQVVFTTAKGEILYQGKIDDQALAPGQKKFIVRDYYLLNAMKEFDKGQPVTVAKTKAVGCYLEE